MVGRAEEIARLTELWERTRSELRPHVALLIAEPGVGKSRLTDELASRLEGSADIYRGRCLSFGEGITYWPVMEMLRDMAGITLEDSTDETGDKLGSLLETVGTDDLDELRTMASALASLVGVPRTPRGTFQVSEITRAELHWGVRRLFELLAAQRPLFLVFEDLHWGEEALLDFVEFLEKGVGPILAVATARTEIEEKAPALVAPTRRRRVVRLAPLGEHEAGDLIRELLGDADISDDEIVILREAAEGNPLLMEEIAEARSRGETLDPLASAGIPLGNRLRVMVEARLDALPQFQSRILQQAAVFGAAFGAEELAEITTADGELPALLLELADLDLIRPAEVREAGSSGRYDFKHDLVREAAYERLPKAERSRIHERCGRWFLSRPGGEDTFVEVAAFHLERSCLLARQLGQVRIDIPIIDAVRTLTRAAERAQSREGMSESDSFYGRALGLADPGLPESTAEIQVGRAVTGLALGQRDRVAEELESASEQAKALGRPDLRGRALLRLASLDRGQGRAAQAFEKIQEAASIAGGIADPDLEARAKIQEAVFLNDVRGETEAAVAELRQVVEACEKAGDRSLEVQARYFLGICLYNSGDLEAAERELMGCVELAGSLGSMRDEARASHLLALAKFYRGDLDEVERLSMRSLAWVERTTDNYLRLQTLVLLAKRALMNGDPQEAVKNLEEALPIAQQRGAWHIADVSRYLAQALAEQGDAAGASKVATEALEHCTEQDAYIQAAVAMAEGVAAGASGDEEKAIAKFVAALELLETQALWLDLAEARLAFAEMLTRLGRLEESEVQLVAGRALAAKLGAGMLAGAAEAAPA
jgi:predicted ATPase